MIKHCSGNTCISLIRDYINEDYMLAPYLYNNLEIYGLNNKNVEVWIDIEDSISAIYLRYFNALHIFSREKNIAYKIQICMNGRLGFIPSVIMVGENNKNKEELSEFDSKKYESDKEWIYEKDTKFEMSPSYIISNVTRKELKDVARLMMEAKLYQEIYNSRVELEEQLIERFDAGYGKCFAIKDKDIIVSSCSISANNLKFGIVGNIMVKEEYRRKGIGNIVCNAAWNSILDEKGKRVIDMVATYNNASIQFHEANGFKKNGVIYKYRIRKDKEND